MFVDYRRHLKIRLICILDPGYAAKTRRMTRAQGYKTFFMLSSVEHEIFPAHIC